MNIISDSIEFEISSLGWEVIMEDDWGFIRKDGVYIYFTEIAKIKNMDEFHYQLKNDKSVSGMLTVKGQNNKEIRRGKQ